MVLAVVVLNWKNASDTLNCIQSVVDSRTNEKIVLVACDNNSEDGSADIIGDRMREVFSSVKIVDYHAGKGTFHGQKKEERTTKGCNSANLGVLIRIDKNLGFAGGNNVGLRWVLQRSLADVILLLNNDAEVDTDALQLGADFMRADRRRGLAGCLVLHFHKPGVVQAFGGASFNAFLGRAQHLCRDMHVRQLPPVDTVRKKIDYPLGAAMFVSREFLKDVGLMYEKYFLYFEEIDWVRSAVKRGYVADIVPDAIVFHKEGETIGSDYLTGHSSLLSERYQNRARMMFTRRWNPWCLPSVVLYNIFLAVRAGFLGDRHRALIIINATLEGLRVPL